MALVSQRKGVHQHVPGKSNKPVPHWTKVYLGVQPEVALGVLVVVGWGITLLLDNCTDVLDKIAII